MLTQEILKKYLHYDPETGIFTRLLSYGNVKIGDIANNIGSTGYGRVSANGKRYLSHRLAWFYMIGEWPTHDVDHINGIRSDNRWDNLREATRSQNLMNSTLKSTNSSGVKGVSIVNSTGKWIAQCTIKGKRYYLGTFNTKECAGKAYDNFTKQNHGEFYRNLP